MSPNVLMPRLEIAGMKRLPELVGLALILLESLTGCGSKEVALEVNEDQLRETEEFIRKLPPEDQERMRQMQQMRQQMEQQAPGAAP